MISTPLLRLGDTGEAVMRLQGLVGAFPDGNFGTLTAAAVREAQRARGLHPDGVVGPKTWTALLAPTEPPAELSEAAIALVKKWEGFRAKPYLDPVGIPTIGYGTTYYLNGRRVTMQDSPITEMEASVLLRKKMDEFAVEVRGMVKVPLTTGQFGALTSFAYNCGTAALKNSTLLRLLNLGSTQEAAAEFDKWVKGDGKTLPGLVSRRAEEKWMFLHQ